MDATQQDEIVESRIWIGTVEIVSRVNWTQIARVRTSLGLAGELGSFTKVKRFGAGKRVSVTALRPWRDGAIRAA